jgi:hypothetical protein
VLPLVGHTHHGNFIYKSTFRSHALVGVLFTNHTNSSAFQFKSTLRKCSIELLNDEECAIGGTDDDSSTTAGPIILRHAQDYFKIRFYIPLSHPGLLIPAYQLRIIHLK